MKRRPGQNPMLAKIQARNEELLAMQRLFTLQQGLDMAMIALSDVFGFGKERLVKFAEAYNSTVVAYCDMANENGEADPEMLYVRAKVDGKLQQLLLDRFTPWEERYDFPGLYLHYHGGKKR